MPLRVLNGADLLQAQQVLHVTGLHEVSVDTHLRTEGDQALVEGVVIAAVELDATGTAHVVRRQVTEDDRLRGRRDARHRWVLENWIPKQAIGC